MRGWVVLGSPGVLSDSGLNTYNVCELTLFYFCFFCLSPDKDEEIAL